MMSEDQEPRKYFMTKQIVGEVKSFVELYQILVHEFYEAYLS